MKRLVCALTLVFAFCCFAAVPAYAAGSDAPVIDLTPLFQAAIAVLATIITAKVIPWLKARLTAEQQAALAAATRVAVFAAEQIYGAGEGRKKLEYAQTLLLTKGYRVDPDAIEAAVRELTILQGGGTDE